MAQRQWLSTLGLPINAILTSTSSRALSASGTWQALSWIQPDVQTLNAVRIRVSAIAGTQANLSLTLEIWTDSGTGIPSAIIASQTATITNFAAGWQTISGFTAALSAGTQYWLVLKNTAVAPTVDYPSIGWEINVGACGGNLVLGGNTGWGWGAVATVDSGVTWATGPVIGIAGFRLDYADGTSGGLPIYGNGNGVHAIYGITEVGARFTAPTYGRMVVRGAAFIIRKANTPADDLVYKLYADSTLIATSAIVPRANILTTSSTSWCAAYFPTAVQLTPGGIYRLTVAMAAAGGDASNWYYRYHFTVDNNGNSPSCFPFNMQYTVMPAATDDNTKIPDFVLILDTDNMFSPKLLTNPGLSGGLR